MSKHTASAVKPTPCCPNAVPGRACDCSECSPRGWENTCPPGCDCLLCLVDELSANPPRGKAA